MEKEVFVSTGSAERAADATPTTSGHEADLRRKLAEKDLLLREVHHRVKNNLMTITSYLSVQASGLSADAFERGVILEARSRVESMVRLYDLLSRSEDFITVPASQYFQELIDHIRWMVPDPGRIFIKADCEDVILDSRLLFTLGMAVNELVMNAIKHGFPDGRQGSVRISLRRDAGGGFLAEVQDDGVGMPSGNDLRQGLGLSLVPALAAQIGGTADRTSAPGQGTIFRLRIP